MSGFPVVVVESGGVAVTLSDTAAPALNAEEGLAVTIVESGGLPLNITNYNPDPYGPECWVQPGFDASTGLTLTRCTVSGGQLHFPGDDNGAQRCLATSVETLTAGDYQFELDVAATDDGGSGAISIGGTLVSFATGTGLKTGTITTTATNQLIFIQDTDGTAIAAFNSFSVKRVL